MTALKHPTNRSHLAKLEDILISPVFVHLCGPPVNRKSFILALLSRRRKVATPKSKGKRQMANGKNASGASRLETLLPFAFCLLPFDLRFHFVISLAPRLWVT